MDDEPVAGDELQERVGDVRKERLVLQKRRRQPMHRLDLGRHVALGIDVAVVLAPRGDAVQELDAADLDQAVAALGVEPGGLSVEDDLAHAPLVQ